MIVRELRKLERNLRSQEEKKFLLELLRVGRNYNEALGMEFLAMLG